MGEDKTAQWDSGSLIKGLKAAITDRLDYLEIEYDGTQEYPILRDLLPEQEKGLFYDPISLLRAPSDEYGGYAEEMLTTSFVTSQGQFLSWVFGIIREEGNRIKIQYKTMTSAALIGQMLVNPKLTNQGRGYGKYGNTGVRLIPGQLEGTLLTITFPVVEDTEIEELMYRKEGDRQIDIIAKLFPGSEHKVHHDVLYYIKKNPEAFRNKVNSTIDFLTKEEVRELYNLLTEGVGDDQEWHTGEQGEFFTLDGSENLGNTDYFKDDGFDIIHNHGDVHLSDISPEESETAIPQGTKKVKKTVLQPRLDKGPFNIKVNEGTHPGHYGHVFSDKLSY